MSPLMPKGKSPAKASKTKPSEAIARARRSNIKSEEERRQFENRWDEEIEDMIALLGKERHRRRVSMTTFMQTGSASHDKSIKLARLKQGHRGVQYAGRAQGFMIRLNVHPGAHAGSKNAADNLETSMTGLTRLVVWSAVGDDARLVTHFEWDDGQLVYPQRFIKRIVVINAKEDVKSIPTGVCWYVIDKAGKVIKYE